MSSSNYNLDESINKINEIYNNLSYFDLYGSSVFTFIFVTLIFFAIYLYFKIMVNAEQIRSDWNAQRCNPKVIPFAGFINKPDDKTISEYTSENFSYCLNNTLVGITGYSVQPFNFLLSGLTNIFNDFTEAIDKMRTLMSNIRNNIASIIVDLFQRIMNILVPLEAVFIKTFDTLHKVHGVMTVSLYSLLGSYFTLQSLMGAVMQFALRILVIMVAVISVMWLIPVSWPIATSLTVMFSALAIPLSIMLVVLKKGLHINPGLGIPTLKKPKVRRCFDENTIFTLENGKSSFIKELNPGSILLDGSRVTSIIQLDASNVEMYDLNGIIISGDHMVFDMNYNWIPVSKHLNAKHIEKYDKSHIYCITTTNKRIILNDIIFADWDDLYGDNLAKILNKNIRDKEDNRVKIGTTCNIHRYLHGGFVSDTQIHMNDNTLKSIDQISINDTLQNGNKVYGIVKIDTKDLDIYEYNLGHLEGFIGGPNQFIQYDSDKLSTIDLGCLYKTKITTNKTDKLYHLLTQNGTFSIGTNIIFDYNSGIDFLL